MIVPYLARLVAVIGSDIIELRRFQVAPVPSAIRCVTSDLTCPWRLEWTLRDKECISDRPRLIAQTTKRRYKYHKSK